MGFERFNTAARRVLVLAKEEAGAQGYTYIDSGHLLLALLRDEGSPAQQALAALGVSLERARTRVGRLSDVPVLVNAPLQYSSRAQMALDHSAEEATKLGSVRIGPEHLLLALVRSNNGQAMEMLQSFGLNGDQVRLQVITAMTRPVAARAVLPDPPSELSQNLSLSAETGGPDDVVGRRPDIAARAVLPDSLSELSQNLSLSAETGRPADVVGRRPDIDLVLQVLSRRARNVALLVGDPGVGKTSVAVGLAQAVARGEVPERFRGRTVLRLDVTALFTDPRHHGRFTEVMAELVGDILRSSGLVLFLDNALSVVRTREGQAEALAFFRPVFDVPGISVVAAAGSADHRRWERDSGLDRRIQPVPVAEPTPEDVLQILRDARQRLVDHHEVVITDEALAAAARLAHGYLPGHALPGAAIDLLDEASAHVRSGPVAPGTTPSVTEDAVTRTAGTSAALPVAPRPPVLSPPVPHDPTVWAMS
ncbi:ATP-dependent Clp protease ATP-binding subunit ClpC [Streptomyces sp. TLI_053]|uniref:Clp protease N-terminal domain-containing protein n=1 Tax=Streptomyces sp. TLI_053 TaxID=1855352 RepID=UPI00087CEC78|nr:Clp protease N-terminal domain-containing protein [Streptomyces sp. TLI_053]SDT41322.1 ATP-dependent Clp protease ATP-binding subunit ClpC [Streptomyces sp. TLI_053]